MRILGLDHGTERVGVAISDELRMIAQPLEYIPSHPLSGVWARLAKIREATPFDLIVIGMPRNMDGSYGPATEKVRTFIEQMQAEIDIPVKTCDERLSSAQANRVLIQANVSRKKRKEKVDKMAATIILQSYLDSTPM